MKLGEVLAGGDGGSNRALRIALIALLVAGGGYLGYDRFLADRPAPVPEGAILPAKRQVRPPEATPPAGASAGAGAKAAAPAAPAAKAAPGRAAAKGAADAKPADAAKTVSVPTAPAAKAPDPKAPAPKAPAPKAPAPKAVPQKPAAPAASGTSTQSVATPRQGPSAEVASATIQREVFSYDAGRRRDPFVSLAKQGDVGPLLAELKLVGIAYDEVGRNSVAVLRDQAKGLYRVKIGQSVGRARVATIGRRSVTFNVDEFGVTRQEVMTLRDTTRKGM